MINKILDNFMSSSSGFVLQRRTGFTKIEPEWFENNKMLAKVEEIRIANEKKLAQIAKENEKEKEAAHKKEGSPKKFTSVGTSTVKDSAYESDSDKSATSTISTVSTGSGSIRPSTSVTVIKPTTVHSCHYHPSPSPSPRPRVYESESKCTSHITVPVLVHGISYLPVVVAGRPYSMAVPVATSAYATLDTTFVATPYYEPLARIVPSLKRF